MASGAKSPQSLKTLDGIPEVEAAKTATQTSKTVTKISEVEAVTQNTGKATVDIRKFSKYIFSPNSEGKQVVFEKLGYSGKDSAKLAEIWKKQASEKFAKGEYKLGVEDKWGKRITIEIELKGVGNASDKTSYMKSGWMLNEDGTIKLNTPFSGFTR